MNEFAQVSTAKTCPLDNLNKECIGDGNCVGGCTNSNQYCNDNHWCADKTVTPLGAGGGCFHHVDCETNLYCEDYYGQCVENSGFYAEFGESCAT